MSIKIVPLWEPTGARLGRSGDPLEVDRGALGTHWASTGALWGAHWGSLGVLWGPTGNRLEGSGGTLGVARSAVVCSGRQAEQFGLDII